MKQIFIKVNGIKTDIRLTTEQERFNYYINVSHGVITDLADKLLDELIKAETPFAEVATDGVWKDYRSLRSM